MPNLAVEGAVVVTQHQKCGIPNLNACGAVQISRRHSRRWCERGCSLGPEPSFAAQ